METIPSERNMKHEQKKVFFLNTSIGNLDNLVDLEDESPQTFDKVEDALDRAKELIKEYGLQVHIYKCIPVFKVDQGRIRVTKL